MCVRVYVFLLECVYEYICVRVCVRVCVLICILWGKECVNVSL